MIKTILIIYTSFEYIIVAIYVTIDIPETLTKLISNLKVPSEISMYI